MLLNHLFFRIGKERVKEGVIFGVAILFQVALVASRDKELENVVKIGTVAYRNEWKEVKIMAGSNEPNMYRNFYWNLCGAREGRLADDLLKGRWGSSSSSLFLSTGQKDPYFQGWMPVWKSGPHEHRAIPTPVSAGAFAGSRRMVTILHPCDAGSVPIVAVEASTDVKAADFEMVLRDGTRVVLHE